MTNHKANFDMPYPCQPYPKLIINLALTGMVSKKANNPNVPVTVDEIVSDIKNCYKAGVSAVHIHARDKNENPTYDKNVYAEIIKKIRSSCPDIIICASTSGRIHKSFEQRSEVLELSGDLKPDMASLTLGSLNFINQASVNEPEMIKRLALKMKDNNILPELEIFDTGMINTAKVLIKKQILEPPFYGNLLLGSIYTAQGTLFDLASMASTLPENFTWGAAGIGKFQQKMNFASMLMGGHVRVGLEDNLYYDTAKTQFATNKMLVDRIVRFADEIGREIASPKEARGIIGLN